MSPTSTPLPYTVHSLSGIQGVKLLGSTNPILKSDNEPSILSLMRAALGTARVGCNIERISGKHARAH